MGKTRLALAVAADAVERYPGGVWLVELAGVTDPAAVAAAALAAVDTPQVAGASTVAELAQMLGDDPCLILIDNAEHLAETCATLIGELLGANGAASVLATSREPLGVPGEVVWRVPSLSAPPADEPRRFRCCRSTTQCVCSWIERAAHGHRSR